MPRDVAARNAKAVVDEGRGVGPQKNGVYLDFSAAIQRLGRRTIEERYGNLFEMYEKITGEDPYVVPMRIYPAPHYTMGGLWVDYNLMSNVPGLFVLGEANFSDHGANRLGASALMQGLADGYFVIPYTIGDYLAPFLNQAVSTDTDAFRATEAEVQDRIDKMLSDQRQADGGLLPPRARPDRLGLLRHRAQRPRACKKALQLIPELRQEFWSNLKLVGAPGGVNQELEKAGRVADFFELAELMCLDALDREESCGGHLREEYQTPDGEALRNDEKFLYVAAWEWNGVRARRATLHKEPLTFEYREADSEELQVMDLTLYIWRQPGPAAAGKMVKYEVKDVNEHSSFLEMLDVLNEQLVTRGEEPVAFDHDCREGICGSCGFMINGDAHGPQPATTVCQLHMRHFKSGDVLHLEPWRARAFPVVKDLMVNRSAFDRIVQAGGFISVSTGSAPEANLTPIPKPVADRAFDAAAVHRLRRLRGPVPERRRAALHLGQGLAPEPAAPGPAREVRPRARHGGGHGAGGLRLLLQLRRVRGRLPQGDLDRLHRPHEPGLPQGQGQGRDEGADGDVGARRPRPEPSRHTPVTPSGQSSVKLSPPHTD